MDSDKSQKLPQLQGANYAPWYLALRMYAFEIEATDHLTGNPIPHTGASELRQHEGKQNGLLAAVLSSVSMDILGLLLGPEETPTAYDLIQKVIHHINQSTKEDHQFLKVEAETITLEDNDIDNFIAKHLQVRQKIVAARYPSINDESTTIDFLLSGLKGQPSLTPIIAHLMTNTPSTIRDFTRKFKALYSLYQPRPTPPPIPATNGRITGDYGPPPPRYNQQRQQFHKPYPPIRIPIHQLCKYHKSLGVRCNHTDEQCRDPGHPKFRNLKPQANYMENHHMIPMHQYPTFPQTHPFHDNCAPAQTHPQAYEDNQEADRTTKASKFVLAHFIKNREDIPTYVQAAIAHIIHRMQHPLRDLRSDNANEYTSQLMRSIYNKYGITHHLRTPHQPQENGIAERLNRTIMESVRALLHTAKLDDTYWEDAARDTIFKYNLMHHGTTNTSPYQLWYNSIPKIKRIFTFGQLGTVPVYAPKKKLETRADPARYMYATSITHVMIINLRTGLYQHIRADDFHPYHKQTDPTVTTATAFKTRIAYKQPPPIEIHIDTPPPTNLTQARKYPDAHHWEQAHNAELHNLDTHNSIQWLPLNFQPPPKSIIPLMMIYRYNRSAEGHILQRKARCNLRSDLMIPGLHYDPKHTTTYTADRTMQRLLIAIHAAKNLPLEHFDIKSAYLHEQYQHDKPIYVKQMPKFDGSYSHAGTYDKLVGNLYGSPPAAYYYNHGLQKFLTSLGYQSSEQDPCLYTKHTPEGSTLISTTIDDFLVLATNKTLIDELYKQLLTKYKIKRLGQPTRFLNWTITRTKNGIYVSQPDSIDAILHQTKMQDCNPTLTPYGNMKPLDQQDATKPLTPSEATRYRQILGEIRYKTDSTRPDIAYATNRLAQHMATPQQHHQQALKSLLRYMKGTKTHGLFYPHQKEQPTTSTHLNVFSDADFANEKNCKSITGMVHNYHATTVSWNSRRQNVVSLSTTETEYIAATDATRHTTWLRKLLLDTQLDSEDPTLHHIDNRSAILIASNKAPTKQRKYIDIRHHYLQHHANNETIAVRRIPTQEMLADILTKPLPRERFQELRTALNITPRPEQK